MKSVVLVMASLFLLMMTSMCNHKREETAYKFCEDVWLAKKSDDQIIQQYLVENTNKDVSDSVRNSLIKAYLDNLRETKPAGSINGIKVQPYSNVTPLSGLDASAIENDIYAITENNKVLVYTLFEKDRISSFTILTKGQRSYFLKF